MSAPIELINVVIDGVALQVPKGTLVIRAAEQIGIQIPRFCDHPLLAPVANCRACLVEIEGQPKPQPSCATTLTEGMVVKTQYTSELADAAQQGVMEFLLINHPLDCPVCDKGGECPLQNQAMTNGRGETRFDGQKREFEKPINVSAQVLLDRERCVSCARCTRFADEIAGDPMLALLERGAQQQVGISADEPFDSYFSGNTIQICPVGALTSAKYRFKSRPFDLVSVPTTCEHCASGCSLRTDIRRGQVQRRLAWDDPEVNEEWNCDKGRFAFPYLQEGRLTQPLVRDADGMQRVASWPEALRIAAEGLKAANSAAVLAGGRHTLEDAYALSKFARLALKTNDIDFRARPHSEEEAEFLGAFVAGSDISVTYDLLEKAPHVVLLLLEVEDESPMIQLRLRKAVRKNKTRISVITSHITEGSYKLDAQVVTTKPGDEVSALRDIEIDSETIVLVGERAASVPGLLSELLKVKDSKNCKLAWVPRRAGERGAVDAGLLPNLLPGGRSVLDTEARLEFSKLWGVNHNDIPATVGKDFTEIVASAKAGNIDALLITGFDAEDTLDPTGTLEAVYAARFVVSFEQRPTAITALADVVFPVAAVTEKSGTFVDWEGRPRPFTTAIRDNNQMSDSRIVSMLADAMDVFIGSGETLELRREFKQLGAANARVKSPSVKASKVEGVTLSTWPQLIDNGVMQSGEPYLQATARDVVARISHELAESLNVADGDVISISTSSGTISLPIVIVEGHPEMVWLPTNSADSAVRSLLHAEHGSVVNVRKGRK
ncbi:MAG: NADH-quinone oxidoreductase subunit G [Candidatus Nanopelagicales bacterium]